VIFLSAVFFLSHSSSAFMIEGRFVDLLPAFRPHARVFLDHGAEAPVLLNGSFFFQVSLQSKPGSALTSRAPRI
jgi:hypothetical protein